MTNYQKGDRFEKRVLAELESEGYIGWQSRVSRSPADIVALKHGETLLVQVKSGSQHIGHDEWNRLFELADTVGARAVLAVRDGRKVRYRQIRGKHVPRTHLWPCEPFVLDQVAAGVAK